MAYHNNPRIITSNLKNCIDTKSRKCYPDIYNILNAGTWVSGSTGSQSGFNQNGLTAENVIILDTDPFGNQAVIWQATPDSNNDADGGWNTSFFEIDNTKMYRFSVWVKKNHATDGRFYLGCRGYDASNSNVGVYNRSNLTNNTNPYFMNDLNPVGVIDEWGLMVGHIWPVGSGIGSAHSDSGRYNASGTKIAGAIDYVWKEDNAKAIHRSYLYYCTNTSVRQYFVYPRVDIVDGTEPSISDLLNNSSNSFYANDIVNNLEGKFLHGVSVNAAGEMVFDGINGHIILNSDTTLLKNSYSISAWINIDDFNGSKRNKGRTFIRDISSNFTRMIAFYNGGLSFETNTNSDPHEISSLTTTGNVSASNIVAGNWFHFCLVFNFSNFYVYVNGELKGSGTIVDDLTFNRIGDASGFADAYPDFFKGKISNFLIYDKSLSQSEVLGNYNAHKSRFGL